MIPRAFVTAWREHAPWATDAQVEQDLVISRAIAELFADDILARLLAFRGGTAIHKVLLPSAKRYSEDIDLVQTKAGPLGPLLSRMRATLDWLGTPKSEIGPHSSRLVYRFQTEIEPRETRKLKVEINTREHFCVLGFEKRRFSVESAWWSGQAEVRTYAIEELLGTKLRAFYQRKKGRDAFDLDLALRTQEPDPVRVVDCFLEYAAHQGVSITRAQFEQLLSVREADREFMRELRALLPTGAGSEPAAALQRIRSLIEHLPGEPWKGAR